MKNVIVKTRVNEGFLQELEKEVQTNKSLPVHIAAWMQEVVRTGKDTIRGARDPLRLTTKA